MIIVGHRGARGEHPENTLSGFQHLLKLGISHVELDVRLSLDNVPVVIHDKTLERTTKAEGEVNHHNAAYLAAHDIPSLHTVFQHCHTMSHYQLEVKADKKNILMSLCKQMLTLIKEFTLEKKVVVTSSSIQALKYFYQHDANIERGYVAIHAFPNPIKTALTQQCTYLILNGRLCNQSLIEKAHKNNLHVSAWTINEITHMEQLVAMGVDSIITDYPTKAVNHFHEVQR